MNDILISDSEVKSMVQDVARKITLDDWKPDFIVGITRGGLIPSVMLSHYLNVPMHTLTVNLRDGNEEDCEHNCWMADNAFGGFEGEMPKTKILIVDDINDSGATFNWIKNDWENACYQDTNDEVWHKNVRFCTLVNNMASKANIDYWSMEINKEEDPSWVHFPWEDWWVR